MNLIKIISKLTKTPPGLARYFSKDIKKDVKNLEKDTSKIKESSTLPVPKITRANKNDLDSIIRLINSFFIPNEPLCRSLGLTKSPLLNSQVSSNILEGYSMIAKDEETIVATAVNSVITTEHSKEYDALAFTSETWEEQQLFHFLSALERAPDIFRKYKAEEVFLLGMLCVDGKYQGHGLGLDLVKTSRNLAKAKNFKILRIDATSYYTAQICEKLMMKMVYSVPYSYFVDKNHKPVFKTVNPHLAAKVYIQELN